MSINIINWHVPNSKYTKGSQEIIANTPKRKAYFVRYQRCKHMQIFKIVYNWNVYLSFCQGVY